MVYRPTGSARIRYPPVPSLVVVRAWLVSTLVALIVAPATTAPVGSWTVPRIEPVTSALSPSQVVMKRISRVVTGPASKVRRSFILSPFVSVAAHTPTAKMRSRMPQRELGIKQYRRGRIAAGSIAAGAAGTDATDDRRGRRVVVRPDCATSARRRGRCAAGFGGQPGGVGRTERRVNPGAGTAGGCSINWT